MQCEHALSLATHSGAKKCRTVIETGHCFSPSFCALHPISKSLSGQSQTQQGHCKMIPFLLGPCSAHSHSSLSAAFAQTQSILSQRLEMFSLAICFSLLNPNHFTHHLPKLEIKPAISLSSSDVAYFPPHTSAF